MTFSEQIDRQYKLKSGAGPARALREKAWAKYQVLGLPGRKTESWKYSSVTDFGLTEWVTAQAGGEDVVIAARELIARYRSTFDVVLLVNGELRLGESSLSDSSFMIRATDGVIGDLHLEDGLVSAAVAIHHGGYDLTLASGVKPQRPLLIVNVQSGENSWSSTLNRITLGEGSELQLAEVFLSGARKYLRTDVTQVSQAQGAVLNWVRTQEETMGASYFSDVQVDLDMRAKLHLTQVNGGAAWARGTVRAVIRGVGAEAHVNGLSFGRANQHVDQRVEIRHMIGQTTSSQLFKGILKDQARGILNGKIYIARHAQKVSSSQLNHNLLLGPQAEADTKPELEIYADDVKANHGASVGKMDDDKLFYLLSRAIPREQAQQMLAQAFVGDVLMKVPNPQLASFLKARVEALLPDYSSQMEAV